MGSVLAFATGTASIIRTKIPYTVNFLMHSVISQKESRRKCAKAFLLRTLAWCVTLVFSVALLFAVDVVLRKLVGGSPNLWLGLAFALIVFTLLFIGVSRVIRRLSGVIRCVPRFMRRPFGAVPAF